MTLKPGTEVSWHYRGAIGHGRITGVHKPGKDEASTEYSIAEHDHHVSASGSREKPTVYHYGSALTEVTKCADEPHQVLAVFYQAGPDPRIEKGADGFRDFFTAAELQKACWSLMQSGAPEVGLFHADGTTGHGQVVESFQWPEGAPDWEMTAYDGTPVVVKSGDWLGRILIDDDAHRLVQAKRVTGASIQGTAKRRRPQ